MAENWIICPFIDLWEMTNRAVVDFLEQSIETRVLLINNGSGSEARAAAERLQHETRRRVLVWHHDPRLPSLSATWNRALDFVWSVEGKQAMVVNNDTRLRRDTYELLKSVLEAENALLVSAVGVREDQFNSDERLLYTGAPLLADHRGGPDFSCYLISRAGHEKYIFDEVFTPAFCEDLDLHRRMMLGGDGSRIFSVNVPFLHYGSQTIQQASSENRAKIEAAIERGSRAYYRLKWGGPVNEETTNTPFGKPVTDGTCTRTPDLQSHGCGGVHSVEESLADA